MEELWVHPRIVEKHPELSEDEVLHAWHSCLKSVLRVDKGPDEYIAVGVDSSGRMVEMIARRMPDGSFIIYHAFTPPTRKALFELKLLNRR